MYALLSFATVVLGGLHQLKDGEESQHCYYAYVQILCTSVTQTVSDVSHLGPLKPPSIPLPSAPDLNAAPHQPTFSTVQL